MLRFGACASSAIATTGTVRPSTPRRPGRHRRTLPSGSGQAGAHAPCPRVRSRGMPRRNTRRQAPDRGEVLDRVGVPANRLGGALRRRATFGFRSSARSCMWGLGIGPQVQIMGAQPIMSNSLSGRIVVGCPAASGFAFGDRCQSGWSYSRAGNHRQSDSADDPPAGRWLRSN